MAKDNNNRRGATPGNDIRITREDVYRGATSKYRKRKASNARMAVILCSVLFIAVVAASVVQLARMERPEKSRQESMAEQFVEENATPQITPADFFDDIPLSRDEVNRGSLILVNYEYEYVFPEDESHLVTVFSSKSENCQVAYNNYMLDGDVMKRFNALVDELKSVTSDSSLLINSTYRTLESQQQIWDDYLAAYGEEYTEKYVANPGNSEHHTGLCLDLTVRKPDGTYVVMENYEHLETFASLSLKHGFIQRYTDNKFNFTKINTEPWHYRYVGVPHAYVMRKQNLCLEEYIEYLKDYTYDGEILTVGESGQVEVCDMTTMPESSYVIYYVPAAKKGDTAVPVPKNAAEFSVSGNNVDGFVVSAVFGEVELPEIVSGVVK